jgi:8-oxo-dGTP pyrophosphatase MutT (NUDIX family)
VLVPGDAVAALILVGERYLLQHRDSRPDIFFPDYWGCFGGNVESGENDTAALVRELSEELAFRADVARCTFFTRFDFDFSFAGCGQIYRLFYEVVLPDGAMAELRLSEGQALGLFRPSELLDGKLKVTPYDAFALWMHINRHRLRPERV